MRACVFVDGENFRHSIVDLFSPDFNEAEYLPKSALWHKFFDYLAFNFDSARNDSDHGIQVRDGIQVADRLRTYWYVVQEIDFRPYALRGLDPQERMKIVSRNRNARRELEGVEDKLAKVNEIVDRLDGEQKRIMNRFNGWKAVQDGISARQVAIEFRRAGSIPYDLHEREFGKEKAVDVKLAVDLLQLASIYDVAVIVSGDGDYVPAVQAIKDMGKRVVNVAFLTRGGKLLPGGARRLNQVTDSVLRVSYESAKSFLMPLVK